jgi:hypothetical protein
MDVREKLVFNRDKARHECIKKEADQRKSIEQNRPDYENLKKQKESLLIAWKLADFDLRNYDSTYPSGDMKK